MPICQIQGTCAGGFEDVRALFENNFRKGHEVNAQLCIYVNGNVVVDLYGTAVGDAEYGPDTLSVRFTRVILTWPVLLKSILYSKTKRAHQNSSNCRICLVPGKALHPS